MGLKTDELTASVSDQEIAWGWDRPQKNTKSFDPSQKNRPYTIWVDGIGALSYQKAQKQTVGFNPTSGAAVSGIGCGDQP